LRVSHKDKQVYVDNIPFGAISEASTSYTCQKNEFGNYEVMLSFGYARGPGWELDATRTPPYVLVLSANNKQNVYYGCILIDDMN
jgi:hypothetical protein